ncbi:hypothetical protein [Streptomyces sp. NRRL S-241]|uniref:hypothetical protein n=1 Tax=Streptomyces sp. NRRL S-241 TaxID=1463896 RepID=UPI00131D1386|nr:hypothetical protein [Streptomyces sp. NRRL S-241]
MSEVSRSGARRSEIEVSSVPEVAALATELTTLFNGLQIPQQQYAARVMLDKSTVSRFLNGRRVASQDFIDRLLSEIERHRRTRITEETRAQIRGLRLAALKKTDPTSFQLENLRDEVDQSLRTIRLLERQQEALTLLLDQREAAAEDAQKEMHELRSVWIAERQVSESSNAELASHNDRLKNERESLQDEILQLKDQLAQVTQLKAGAEDRCAQLEERLLEAERELAMRLDEVGEQTFILTPREAFDEMRQSEADRRYYDAARTLSLSAAHFSVTDLAELWDLLVGDDRRTDVNVLISDAIRFRSAGFCAHITEDLLTRQIPYLGFDLRSTIGTLLGTYKSPEELDYFYSRWKVGGPPYGVLRYTLRKWAETASAGSLLLRMKELAKDSDTTLSVAILYSYGTRDATSIFRLSDLLLSHDMADEFKVLLHRWLPTIPDGEMRKTGKEWMRLAAQSEHSETLMRVFANRL